MNCVIFQFHELVIFRPDFIHVIILLIVYIDSSRIYFVHQIWMYILHVEASILCRNIDINTPLLQIYINLIFNHSTQYAYAYATATALAPALIVI